MLNTHITVLSILLWLISGIHALTYKLDASYSGSSFFRGFNFSTQPDPTNGFVSYISATEASNLGLAGITRSGAAYMGVDYKTQLSPGGPGRKSVRVTSKKSWTRGLFIADIAHMPGGICGTWPAFWSFGPNWPSSGEIDIIEGVNSQKTNSMALHTSPNCVMNSVPQLGITQTSNCDGTTNYNAGCGTLSKSTKSYGKGFNAAGGGVYAMEWTSGAIKIWFFSRSSIPSNIKSGNPSPASWGTPQANFQGCNIDQHFKSHNLVFDITFCGDWAANVWQNDDTCKSLAGSCQDYVAANPSAFKDAYWSINSVKVYTSPQSYFPVSFAAVQNDNDTLGQPVPEFTGDQDLSLTPNEEDCAPEDSNIELPMSSKGMFGTSAAANPPAEVIDSEPSFQYPYSFNPTYNTSANSSIPEATALSTSVSVAPSTIEVRASDSVQSPSASLNATLVSQALNTEDLSQAKGTSTDVSAQNSLQTSTVSSVTPFESIINTDEPANLDGIPNEPTISQRALAEESQAAREGAKTITSESNTRPTITKAIQPETTSKTSPSRYPLDRKNSSSVVPMLSPSSNGTSSLAATPALFASFPPQPNDLVYLGCFTVDESNLKVEWDSQWAYTEACWNTCYDLSKPYSALSGTKCLCGVTGDLGIISSNSQCDTPCPGNTMTACGGNDTQSSVSTVGRRDVLEQHNIITLYQNNMKPPMPWTVNANDNLSRDEIEYLYEGCWFLEINDPPNFELRYQLPDMTRSLCLDACQDYAYFGLYWDECYCGRYIPAQEEHTCTFQCLGDPTTQCGGLSASMGTALSVYRNPRHRSVDAADPIITIDLPSNATQTIAEFTSIGCYSSNAGVTNFKLNYESFAMTHELCFSQCPSSLLAGIYSTGCYCGTSDSLPDLAANGSCNQPCPGNTQTNCGGNANGISLSLFKRRVVGGIPSRKRDLAPLRIGQLEPASAMLSKRRQLPVIAPTVSSGLPQTSTTSSTPSPFLHAATVDLPSKNMGAHALDTYDGGDPSSLGCYPVSTEGLEPTFNALFESPNMTQPLCTNACRGFFYAGVVYSKCYGGRSFDLQRSPQIPCTWPCPGDKTNTSFCGGTNGSVILMSLLITGQESWPETSNTGEDGVERQDLTGPLLGRQLHEHQSAQAGASFAVRGCFPFPSTGFNWAGSNWAMDHEACATTCKSQNMAWAGIHAADCYCATAISDPPILDSHCDSMCANDASQTCGGTTYPALTVLQISRGENTQPDTSTGQSIPTLTHAGTSTIGGKFGGIFNIYLGHSEESPISTTCYTCTQAISISVSTTTTTEECSEKTSTLTATAIPIQTSTHNNTTHVRQDRKKFDAATLDVNAVANTTSHVVVKSTSKITKTDVKTPTTTIPPITSTRSPAVKTEGTDWIDGKSIISSAGFRGLQAEFGMVAFWAVLGFVLGLAL